MSYIQCSLYDESREDCITVHIETVYPLCLGDRMIVGCLVPPKARATCAVPDDAHVVHDIETHTGNHHACVLGQIISLPNPNTTPVDHNTESAV
ncbi:MAG: uncharacterized protein KVP18_004796 [Porospora cf. gigantea A]|uniref:uncharacterized protein n=1 Tax=Porospora cf. gigantea A TaxID=2853593 RepID=UPI00355AC576|nr:MAG: hypothetical protein KVP18_004796 [Porospora cf. gigantea A]